jgi:hypothetical protein
MNIHTDHKPLQFIQTQGEIAEQPPSEVVHLPTKVPSQYHV